MGMITLNLGVVWVLHQNGWVQHFENYLREEANLSLWLHLGPKLPPFCFLRA